MTDKELVLSKIKLYRNHPIPVQLIADIFPLFRCPSTTEAIISHLSAHIASLPDICAIVCLEARGFLFGPLIASRLHLPCVPVRKKGKLPGDVIGVAYEKDYGLDGFEMKTDAFEDIETVGKGVVIVDDLLGKGGSVMAAKELTERLGVGVVEACFVFDVDVPGYTEVVKEKLGGLKTYAMVTLTLDNLGEPVN